MVVLNSATRDPRVMKEADSLQAHGYDVTVVGIGDPATDAPIIVRDDGVRILRVFWRGAVYRGLTRSMSLQALLAVALVLAFAGLAASWLHRVLPDWSPSAMNLLALLSGDRQGPGAVVAHIASLALLAGACLLSWRLLRPVLKMRTVARRTLALETEATQRYAELGSAVPELADRRGRGWRPRWPRWLPDTLADALADALHHPAGIVHLWSSRSAERRRRALAIAEVVCRVRPDVVHCHDAATLPIGAAVKRRLDCSLVYDAHEIYEMVAQGADKAARTYRYLHRKYLPLTDGFITINDSIAHYYKSTYPSLAAPTIIRNATLPAEPITYDGRLHRAAGVPLEQKILLYQGGFATKRGLEELVRAAVFLPSTWTLVMMGWGSHESALRRIATEAGASSGTGTGYGRYQLRSVRTPSVRFIPPAPPEDLVRWTAGATVGVIPYENVGLNHWYCTPNKLWEYPNAGVPILASPFPEIRRIVEGHGIGWLLPLEPTALDIAETVAGLSDEMIAQAHEACRAFIRQDNWLLYEERLVALYDELTGRWRPRPPTVPPLEARELVASA